MTEHDHWDAIVIGSGMGGMAAAAALSRVGHKVLSARAASDARRVDAQLFPRRVHLGRWHSLSERHGTRRSASASCSIGCPKRPSISYHWDRSMTPCTSDRQSRCRSPAPTKRRKWTSRTASPIRPRRSRPGPMRCAKVVRRCTRSSRPARCRRSRATCSTGGTGARLRNGAPGRQRRSSTISPTIRSLPPCWPRNGAITADARARRALRCMP